MLTGSIAQPTGGYKPQVSADASEILRALLTILEPGQVTELRAIDATTRTWRNPHTVSGYFDYDHLDALAKEAATLDAPAIYFLPNPCNPALLARAANRLRDIRGKDPLTADHDITARRRLLIDADAIRPAGISSTDAEHAAALTRAAEIADWLALAGWPEPIRGDSGNGGHLMYLIDLPIDDGGLVQRVLQALAFHFDDKTVNVDQTTHNPARAWKLYGTVAGKGDSIPERPHRIARLLAIPATLTPVPRELLEALAATLPKEPAPDHKPKGGGAFDLDRWIAEHLPDADGPGEWNKGRRWILPVCPWNPDHTNRAAFILQFPSGAIAAGCHHNGCAGHDWHALRDLLEPGWRNRRNGATPRTATTTARTSTATSSPSPTSATAGANDKRPWIHAAQHDLPIITGEAWEAIREANDADPYMFRHAGQVVRLGLGDHDRPILVEMGADRLRVELANAARFFVWDETVKGKGDRFRKLVKPLVDVVQAMLAARDNPLPILTRLVEAPVFAHDGQLQLTPGYHPASHTYYCPPAGLVLPPVSDNPTESEIARARELILGELLGEFPFVGPADKAHAVAALLLPFARDFIDEPTPGHLVEAPTPGSGKGLLVDVITCPAYGRGRGVVPEARDDDEWRKRLTSQFREGHGAILIDNVARPLDSGTLSAALTAMNWTDRLLGKNETISLPVRCLWLVTGNNPTMSTEIARRMVRIRLDPRIDQPWRREGFKHPELRTWADDHRGELVWAALTFIRFWLASGGPGFKGKRLGSYEQWSTVIGGILDTAKIAGFLTNLDEFYETADLEGAVWRQFVALWWEKFADREVLARDLFPVALTVDGLDLGTGKGRAMQTAFGMKLAKQRDRVIGEYRIVCTGTQQRVKRWRLIPTTDLFNMPPQGVPVYLSVPFTPSSDVENDLPSISASSSGPPEVHRGTQVHFHADPEVLGGDDEALDATDPAASSGTELQPDPDTSMAAATPGATPEAAPTTASVPVMITRAMRADLADMGYTEADIGAMTPQAAWDALQLREEAGAR